MLRLPQRVQLPPCRSRNNRGYVWIVNSPAARCHTQRGGFTGRAGAPRREFSKMALLALPTTKLFAAMRSLGGSDSASAFAGVQIGLNVPYSFCNNAMNGDDVLKACVQLGVGAVELRSQPVEAFLGAPPGIARGGRGADAAARAAAQVLARNYAEQLRVWRATAAPEGAKAFRKKYEDAGVMIEIVKFDDIYNMTDSELDFAFALAKTLGARALSCEISAKDDDLKRVGKFADKHSLMVGYHGHTQVTPAIWGERILVREAQWRKRRHRPLHRGQQLLASGVHQEVPRAHHAHPHQGPQAARGSECAVWPGRYAHRRSAAPVARPEVADPGDPRVRVSRAGRVRPDDGDREVGEVLPRCAGLALNQARARRLSHQR